VNTPDDTRTTYLGKFDEFEAQIVVELLEDAGIFAYTKVNPTENEHVFYAPQMESERGVVLVDATKAAEARRVVDEELPKHLESIRESMDAMEKGEQIQSEE
jgi:tRNA G26 N,N-dimethylase Trm1